MTTNRRPVSEYFTRGISSLFSSVKMPLVGHDGAGENPDDSTPDQQLLMEAQRDVDDEDSENGQGANSSALSFAAAKANTKVIKIEDDDASQIPAAEREKWITTDGETSEDYYFRIGETNKNTRIQLLRERLTQREHQLAERERHVAEVDRQNKTLRDQNAILLAQYHALTAGRKDHQPLVLPALPATLLPAAAPSALPAPSYPPAPQAQPANSSVPRPKQGSTHAPVAAPQNVFTPIATPVPHRGIPSVSLENQVLLTERDMKMGNHNIEFATPLKQETNAVASRKRSRSEVETEVDDQPDGEDHVEGIEQNGTQKYACIQCIRGHRVSRCKHEGHRPMLPVRKPGRPKASHTTSASPFPATPRAVPEEDSDVEMTESHPQRRQSLLVTLQLPTTRPVSSASDSSLSSLSSVPSPMDSTPHTPPPYAVPGPEIQSSQALTLAVTDAEQVQRQQAAAALPFAASSFTPLNYHKTTTLKYEQKTSHAEYPPPLAAFEPFPTLMSNDIQIGNQCNTCKTVYPEDFAFGVSPAGRRFKTCPDCREKEAMAKKCSMCKKPEDPKKPFGNRRNGKPMSTCHDCRARAAVYNARARQKDITDGIMTQVYKLQNTGNVAQVEQVIPVSVHEPVVVASSRPNRDESRFLGKEFNTMTLEGLNDTEKIDFQALYRFLDHCGLNPEIVNGTAMRKAIPEYAKDCLRRCWKFNTEKLTEDKHGTCIHFKALFKRQPATIATWPRGYEYACYFCANQGLPCVYMIAEDRAVLKKPWLEGQDKGSLDVLSGFRSPPNMLKRPLESSDRDGPAVFAPPSSANLAPVAPPSPARPTAIPQAAPAKPADIAPPPPPFKPVAIAPYPKSVATAPPTPIKTAIPASPRRPEPPVTRRSESSATASPRRSEPAVAVPASPRRGEPAAAALSPVRSKSFTKGVGKSPKKAPTHAGKRLKYGEEGYQFRSSGGNNKLKSMKYTEERVNYEQEQAVRYREELMQAVEYEEEDEDYED